MNFVNFKGLDKYVNERYIITLPHQRTTFLIEKHFLIVKHVLFLGE